MLCLWNIPAFPSGTHSLTSAGGTQAHKKRFPGKTTQQGTSKNFSNSWKTSVLWKYVTHPVAWQWGGLRVLLALTRDILHSCSGIHLLWVMVNILSHAGRNLVWCQCGYSLQQSVHPCVCQCWVPVIGKGGLCLIILSVPFRAVLLSDIHTSGSRNTGFLGESLQAELFSQAACAWITSSYCPCFQSIRSQAQPLWHLLCSWLNTSQNCSSPRIGYNCGSILNIISCCLAL